MDWDAHFSVVFDSPPPTANPIGHKVIARSATLSGCTFLDELRLTSPGISVQPTVSAFQASFDTITDSLLKGLDWKNVFVAGGIVLSSLLAVTDQDVKRSV